MVYGASLLGLLMQFFFMVLSRRVADYKSSNRCIIAHWRENCADINIHSDSLFFSCAIDNSPFTAVICIYDAQVLCVLISMTLLLQITAPENIQKFACCRATRLDSGMAAVNISWNLLTFQHLNVEGWKLGRVCCTRSFTNCVVLTKELSP